MRRLRTARRRAAPPQGQPSIFSSFEEEKTGRWAVQKRRTGVAVTVAVPICGLVPGALCAGETEKCFPAFASAVYLSD